MRYFRVTHTYVVAMPSEEALKEGIAIVDAKLREFAPGIQAVNSTWQIMPREYGGDREFIPQETKVPHPWDQGLYIFPIDHPLAALERQYRDGYDVGDLPDAQLAFEKKVLELRSGEEDDE